MSPLLPPAIEGHRFLGLDERAALAEEVRGHGFDMDAEEDALWEAYDERWLGLASAERVRAVYIREHPAEFASG